MVTIMDTLLSLSLGKLNFFMDELVVTYYIDYIQRWLIKRHSDRSICNIYNSLFDYDNSNVDVKLDSPDWDWFYVYRRKRW